MFNPIEDPTKKPAQKVLNRETAPLYVRLLAGDPEAHDIWRDDAWKILSGGLKRLNEAEDGEHP